MNIKTLFIFTLPMILAASAFGQTIYKCSSPTQGAPPIIQQMPCSPTGGGETMQIKSIPTGAGSGLSDEAKAYMDERDKHWDDKAKAAAEEAKRQDALNAEYAKARAQNRAAAAQEATAAAINRQTAVIATQRRR